MNLLERDEFLRNLANELKGKILILRYLPYVSDEDKEIQQLFHNKVIAENDTTHELIWYDVNIEMKMTNKIKPAAIDIIRYVLKTLSYYRTIINSLSRIEVDEYDIKFDFKCNVGIGTKFDLSYYVPLNEPYRARETLKSFINKFYAEYIKYVWNLYNSNSTIPIETNITTTYVKNLLRCISYIDYETKAFKKFINSHLDDLHVYDTISIMYHKHLKTARFTLCEYTLQLDDRVTILTDQPDYIYVHENKIMKALYKLKRLYITNVGFRKAGLFSNIVLNIYVDTDGIEFKIGILPFEYKTDSLNQLVRILKYFNILDKILYDILTRNDVIVDEYIYDDLVDVHLNFAVKYTNYMDVDLNNLENVLYNEIAANLL